MVKVFERHYDLMSVDIYQGLEKGDTHIQLHVAQVPSQVEAHEVEERQLSFFYDIYQGQLMIRLLDISHIWLL